MRIWPLAVLISVSVFAGNIKFKAARALMDITDYPLGKILIPLARSFDPSAPVLENISLAPEISPKFNNYVPEIQHLLISNQLRVGDHFFYFTAKNGCGYQHHGVHLGNGHILHKPGLEPIEIISYRNFWIRAFEKESKVYRIDYQKPINTTEILTRAEREQQKTELQFSFFFDNCEHFVSEIITGYRYSFQVEAYKILTTSLAMLLGTWFLKMEAS
ncbi:MAG: lecithin retinol acyltransferase family protein [Myxococcaceae bacterium]